VGVPTGVWRSSLGCVVAYWGVALANGGVALLNMCGLPHWGVAFVIRGCG
jgi:hypothetical protein